MDGFPSTTQMDEYANGEVTWHLIFREWEEKVWDGIWQITVTLGKSRGPNVIPSNVRVSAIAAGPFPECCLPLSCWWC